MDNATDNVIFFVKKTPSPVRRQWHLHPRVTAGEKCCSRCETLQLFIYYVSAQKWMDLRFRARLTDKVVESQSSPRSSMVESRQFTVLDTPHSIHPLKAKDNVMPIKEHQGILSRWAEHVLKWAPQLHQSYWFHLCRTYTATPHPTKL